nr:MAG TPA: hypothetical protein [Caudoviricetes sp.]
MQNCLSLNVDSSFLTGIQLPSPVFEYNTASSVSKSSGIGICPSKILNTGQSEPDSFYTYYTGAPIFSIASKIHSRISVIRMSFSDIFESAIILAMTDSHFVYLYIINIYIILIVKYKLSKVPLVFSNKL